MKDTNTGARGKTDTKLRLVPKRAGDVGNPAPICYTRLVMTVESRIARVPGGMSQEDLQAVTDRLSGIRRPYSSQNGLLVNEKYIVIDNNFCIGFRYYSNGGLQIPIIKSKQEILRTIGMDGVVRQFIAKPDDPNPYQIVNSTGTAAAEVFVGENYKITSEKVLTPAGDGLLLRVESKNPIRTSFLDGRLLPQQAAVRIFG